MDFLLKSIFLVLLLFNISYCYVILSGGPYCSNAGYSVSHAVPGTTVSITCAVDNPGGIANLLFWSIPKFGVTLFNVAVDNTVDGTELKSDVTYSDSTTGRTNATLTFLAVSVLDKAIVQCRNYDNPPQSRNCTLFILAPPTAPTSFNCTNITNNSLTLQWSEPTNYGEEVLQYNITGTPGNIGIVEKGTNTVTLKNLLPNNTYHFTITAGNSVGFGNEIPVECTTEGEKNILTTDLPSPEPTLSTAQPKATSMQEQSTETSTTSDTTTNSAPDTSKPTYTPSFLILPTTTSESILATHSLPEPTLNSPSPKATRDMLSNIGVIVGVTVAVVAIMLLVSGIVVCVYCKKRSNSKTSGSSFNPISLFEHKQSQPETATYQDPNTIENDMYTLLRGQSPKPFPPPPPVTELETATYQDPNTVERQQAPTGDMYALPDKPKGQPPPPSPITSITEHKTATYQDPNNSDIRAVPDKNGRPTPPSSPLAVTAADATYQDPSTIQRQQAPTGDIHTMPQKKPQCSKVNGDTKSSGELGLGDSSQPLPQEEKIRMDRIL